jgi:hypothetical protein
MKRSIAIVLPLVLAAAAVRGDDKQPAAKNSVVVAVTSKYKGALRRNQVPQYCLAGVFAQWGFKVESRVQTGWDGSLPKDSVKVVVAAKPGDKVPDPGPAAFTIEGTIEYILKENKFYDQALPVINFVADVNVVVKDANGKELKKIAWKNYYGNNKEAGEESILDESEKRATRFLTVDLFSIKEIADQVPQAKREEFEKFLTKEKEQREKHFDDWEKHKVADEKKEKEAKEGDEKK